MKCSRSSALDDVRCPPGGGMQWVSATGEITRSCRDPESISALADPATRAATSISDYSSDHWPGVFSQCPVSTASSGVRNQGGGLGDRREID
jgi:hypothetical protein